MRDTAELVDGRDMQASGSRMEVRYDVTGSGHKAIVFLPALGTNCEVWHPQIAHLEPDYMVVCCETGGHFPMTLPDPTLSDYADAVRSVLDAVGLLQAHVVGISMGGMVAQELALAYPDRVSSLVLASTTSTYPPQSRQQIANRAEVVRAEGMQALVEATLDRWFTPEFARAQPDEVDRIRAMLLEADPESYARAALAVSTVETAERLPAITAPTLVLKAEYDASMPPTSAENLAAGIPGAKLELIPDAAHLSNLGNPEAFNRLTGEFLNSITGQPDSGAATIITPW